MFSGDLDCGDRTVVSSNVAGNFGSESCMSLVTHADSAFSTRYTGKFGTCAFNPSTEFATVQVAILDHSTSLHAYLNALVPKLKALALSMNTVKYDHDALADKVVAATTNMGKFKDDIQEFLDTITGDTGMISNLNC